MASFPRLAGKEADYLADRLTRYRSGERMGPNTALMAPHAADLSDDEITALSLYLAGLS
jgi:cytochrome c553